MVAPSCSQPSMSTLTGHPSMEDFTDQATRPKSRSAKQSEMYLPEETRSPERSENLESGVAPTHLAHDHQKQTKTEAGLELQNHRPEMVESEVDMEMTDTVKAPVTRVCAIATNAAHPVVATTDMLNAKSEFSRHQAVNTSMKMKSSMITPASLPSAQSTPIMQEPSSASRPISTRKTVADPDTPSEKQDTRLTPTCTVPATPDTSSKTAPSFERDNSRPQTPVRSSLHKRRASASPDKFTSTRTDPLKIDTGLEDIASPTQRGRTQTKLEIYHDSIAGTRRIVSSLNAEPDSDSTASKQLSISNRNSPGGAAAAARRPHVAAKRRKGFSLLEVFVRDNSLLITLVSYLDVPSTISLYAISKSFHLIFNRHATAFVVSSMRTWAPHADKIFPWRCYRQLCILDPIKRQKAVPKAFEADIERLGDLSRDVPSLRWLQMVVWREGIVTDMIMQLQSKALRTLGRTDDAVKRMWFALDLPLNSHRMALFRNKTYMPNTVILLAIHFFIKCDMALTDPGFEAYPLNHSNQALFPNHRAFGGAVGCTLREKLSAERNLTSLWRVLHGWTWDLDQPQRPMMAADIVKLNAKHNLRYSQGTSDEILMTPVMGMLYSDFKFTGCERTFREEDDEQTRLNRPCRPLLPLHTLLVGESVRRKMRVAHELLDMILYGFILPGFRRTPVFTVDEQRKFIKMPLSGQQPSKTGLTATLMAMKESLEEIAEAETPSIA